MHFYFFLLFLFFSYVSAYEYNYPVGILDEHTILYMHQISPERIELLSWNTSSNKKEHVLWSLYNPMGVKLLPHRKGFSFIDNGRLRLQLCNKRSPKAIDFDDPIFNITTLEWITEHICYCAAQHKNHFALFELHDNGVVYYLGNNDSKDYLYPQKVNNTLFFIERNFLRNSFNYRIMQTIYKPKISPQSNLISSMIIDCDNKPIIFLSMVNEQEGFFLEHEKKIERTSQTVLFCYHHIYAIKESWHNDKLFTFELPTALLLNTDERLFESIIPLLPRYIDDTIYFVDCGNNKNNFLTPYSYNKETKEIKKILNLENDRHYFVPMYCNNKLWCGGSGSELSELSIF